MRAACLPNRIRLTSDPSFNSGHVSECLRCQAEAAKYRTLLRYLMEIRSQLVPAPAGLVEVVGRGLSRVTDVPKKSRVREVAFAASGVVAMAGAVTLWRRRVSA